LTQLGSFITHKQDGVPIVVFNSHNWEVSAPVTVKFNTHGFADRVKNRNLEFLLTDAEGKAIDYQIIPSETGEPFLLIEFMAEKMPPLGYKSYYLKQQPVKISNPIAQVEDTYENQFFKITFGKGGVKSIYDKKIGKELLKTEKFLAGEVIEMESVGTGAGEFDAVQQPDPKAYFERLSQYKLNWSMFDNGKVKTTWETTQRFVNATIRFRFTVYHQLPKLDFEYDILGWEGIQNREFRVTFPLNMDKASVAYNVPFGVVTVGRDEFQGVAGYSHDKLKYMNNVKDIRPREVQDWFHANDGQYGITISSGVAVFDWQDPTEAPVNYPVLQGLLLASRKSCNGKGNWYLQPGNHSFRFSMLSHEGNWKNSYRQATDMNQPLFAIALDETDTKPESGIEPVGSMFGFSSNDVIVSTIKLSEEGNDIVFRAYDILGKQNNFSLRLEKPISNIWKTNIIEQQPAILEQVDGLTNITISPYSIETIKIQQNLEKVK